MRTKVAKQRFLEALPKVYGRIGAASSAIGITPEAVRKWRMQDTDFAAKCEQVLRESKEAHHEFLLANADAQVASGNASMTKFLLMSMHGYREQQPIEVRVEVGDLVRQLTPAQALEIIAASKIGQGQSNGNDSSDSAEALASDI